MAKRSAILKALSGELARHGITRYRIEHGARHPRLVFTHAGRERFYPFSPGMFEGPAMQRMVGALRRALDRPDGRRAPPGVPHAHRPPAHPGRTAP